MKRISVFGVFFFVWMVLLVACGNLEESKTPVSSISIEMSEFKFSPSGIVVFAGKEISLNLSNKGAVEHEFSILKKGASAKIPFDRESQVADILFEARLGPNKSGQFKFILPDAGEYQVICGIQGHVESGMVAILTAK